MPTQSPSSGLPVLSSPRTGAHSPERSTCANAGATVNERTAISARPSRLDIATMGGLQAEVYSSAMANPGSAAHQVNVSDLLETTPIGPLQIRVFTLSMLCLIMDGFDVQAMGYVAPALIRDWGIGGPALGPVFAAANLGVLLGSLIFSMVADKIGRRPVMVVATFFFSALTIATAYSQDLTQLLWLRFISGIGLGCIIPQATALVGEFSPKKSRVTLMMCITVGFTVGAAIGGFVAAWLIPAFGWRSVFIFGGAVPLVIAVAMATSLPESLQFLAVDRKSTRLNSS